MTQLYITISFQGESIQVNPWYLMIPATVACSFAFMLPVATPPNAIVFSGGVLKVSDMVILFIITAVKMLDSF